MSKELDYYFDVGSPTAYLSWTQMPKLIEETGAQVNYKPVLLGGIFKATGNSTPVSVPAKGKWMTSDLALWANKYGVPLKMNSKFPVNTLYLQRGLLAYKDHANFAALGDAIFDGMWVSDKDMTDMETVASIVASADIDPAEFAEKINDAKVKQGLIEATEEAVNKGLFGAPSFIVEGQLYFGQDRMEFVKAALVAG